MAKKKPTALSSATSGNIYVGNSSSANNVIITSSGTSAGTSITHTHMAIPTTYYTQPSFSSFNYAPSVTDGFYEDDGRLFWKNSKGEVFQVTFTKQETVKQILEDL